MFAFFSFFSMFICFQSLCFTCLFACLLSHVRIRVHLVYALFQCHDQTFICSCISHRCQVAVRLVKGKSCIRNAHAFVIWSCLDDRDEYACLMCNFMSKSLEYM